MSHPYWPKSWPKSWPKPIESDKMVAVNSQSKAFVTFYQDVMRRIKDHIATKKIGDAQADLLHFLRFGFWWEYEKWNGAPVASFLQRSRKDRTALVVTCLAFFHMAYDLPRVIADSLVAFPKVNLDVIDARDAFYGIDYIFDSALESQLKSFESAGIFALISRASGWIKGLSLHHIAALWVLQIRSRSFHYGEILARAGRHSPSARLAIELKLRSAVIAAMDETLKHKMNPLFWLSNLKTPWLTCLALPLLPMILGPGFWSEVAYARQHTWEVAGEGVCSIIATATYYFGAAYVSLVRLVERIGSEIAQIVDEIMQEALVGLRDPENLGE